jgi:ComF family protein
MSAVRTYWSSFSKELLDWVYPSQCALCGLTGPLQVCESCKSDMVPMAQGADPAPGPGLQFRISAFEYSGRAAQAVRRLKYGRATALATFMSEAIRSLAAQHGLLDWEAVPVPIHWSRRCQRGFNQAELLAEKLPRVLKSGLQRHRATRPQVGLSSSDRASNIAGAFRASESVAGKKIMLVDDVVTSGNTARECGIALLKAGALDVGVISFAGEL